MNTTGKTVLSESDILTLKDAAFETGQFVPYFQPQYNHSTGLIIGAEALARWINPEIGVISPAEFIPVFEKYGDISRLDLTMFEKTCEFMRKLIDSGITPPPVSGNIARYDIYQEGFIERMEEIRKQYDIPVDLLRVEITESTAIGGVTHVNEFIGKLHRLGYIVEMDDFGSGYSSLNMLKNVDIDVLKLDMGFLEQSGIGTRGGAILSSIIRMARIIGLPTIAEGVETKNQADYLKGIGCDNIQGYYYSKPLPMEEFTRLLEASDQGIIKDEPILENSLDTSRFWDPNSAETKLFSHYVGPAIIFYYSDGEMETVRVNEKYLHEVGMNMTVDEAIKTDIFKTMDEAGKKTYINALERAIGTREEQVCETRRLIQSDCCGDDYIYIRSNIKLIGRNNDEFLFYVMIKNITAEKKQFMELAGYEQKFKQVTEQVNIYFWEYTVATKEMRPCFRCMRDLGLPPVVRNYPEPAFEAGIFPMDYADMYRDWHKQIENGVPELEAIIPLTVGRVPFRVKYVTEFDDLGRPIKAYGSATFVNEDELK